MAIVTKTIASDANGQVTFQIDYDSSLKCLTALRCINNTDQAAYGQATLVSNGRSYDQRFPPGTSMISLPTQKALRLDITIDARGRLDGVEYHFMWPYP